jgi:hypothetical protein
LTITPLAARLHHRSAARVMRKVPVSVMSMHLVPLLVGHVDDAPAGAQAGVVDQHVDAAQPLLGEGDQRLHLLLVRDVAQLAVHVLQPGLARRAATASPRRRSWMSLMNSARQPSSAQRFAAAKPMPAPAAAVTSTDLPRSSRGQGT